MKYLITIIIPILLAAAAMAQVGVRPAAFNVDFASFASDSANYNVLEIYYQIYSSNLLHVREDGKYMAKYSVTAIVREGKRQVAADEQEEIVYAETYDEAHNSKSYIINLFKFYIRPGEYKVEVTLNDLNASSSIPLKTTLEVPDYNQDRPLISQIQFARHISDVDESTVFDKNYWRIIPSCSRRYGDGLTWLKFYYEFYNSSMISRNKIDFVHEIRDAKNKIVNSQIVTKDNKEFNSYVDSLSLENLKPGPYDLVIYTRDDNDELVSRVGRLSINWTSLELVKHDFETAVNQLMYIAGSDEMEQLKDAPEENRIQEWNKFWKAKDPSPDTDENELKNEYYRRIAYSNKKYNVPNKDGWRTDMGMVHIIHGSPDDIERHPFDIETKPYEIWYYYSPRRRFLFIDVNGYGEYMLQYPYDGDVSKRINIYGGGP